MSAFHLLSATVRASFALWAMLLCLAGIMNIAYALYQKQWFPAILACVPFALAFLLHQTAYDLSLLRETGTISAVTRTLTGFAWLGWLLALAALTLANLLLLHLGIRNARTHVTPATIKLCADRMPCGICYWRDSGQVVFSNLCMNRLCIALTGQPLLNGNLFREAVSTGVLSAHGRYWRFVCRCVRLDGESLHEMIASDITEVYAKTRMLEKDTEELARMNRELQTYQLGIDDAVRRQEILQAKVNIHDEMNRLMLSATAADRDDADALDRVFSQWERNALLLCMEAEGKAGKHVEDRLKQLALALGIRLIWLSPVPSALSETQKELFFSAAQEAITNAAKHADADRLEIAFQDTETSVLCRFTNDGRAPSKPVRFTGGLANLACLAEKQHATVSVDTEKRFALLLRFEKLAQDLPIGRCN